jgi:molybdopterin-guanine dinucleotide biosynthesis protein A
MRIFGVILAGGQARRMGGADKALLDMAGQPLLAHVISRFAPQVECLALSANGDAARFAGFGLPVLPDLAPHGPLSGILAGLIWAQAQGATAVVSVPVDGPFLPPDLVPRLCLAADATGMALAASHGTWHPTFGLWPVALAPALTDFLTSGVKERVRDFATAHGVQIADFPDDLAFANANTPEDLARFARLIEAAE